MLFIHDLDWIEGATSLFWQHAIEAAKERTAFVVCSRKVSPQTFSVCKKIGARALQYFMPISEQRGRAPARQLERSLGWFGSSLFDGLTTHAISEHLERMVTEPAALDSALILRVADAAETPPAARLSEWRDNSKIIRTILKDDRDRVKTTARPQVASAMNSTRGANEEKMFGRKSEKTRLGVKAR